jgi:hypothetical protein
MSRICETQKCTPLSLFVLTDQRTKGNQSWTSRYVVVVDCRKKHSVVLDMFDGNCTERTEVPDNGNKCTGLQKLANKRVWIAFCSSALLACYLCLPHFFSSVWMSAVDLLPCASEHILRISPFPLPVGSVGFGLCYKIHHTCSYYIIWECGSIRGCIKMVVTYQNHTFSPTPVKSRMLVLRLCQRRGWGFCSVGIEHAASGIVSAVVVVVVVQSQLFVKILEVSFSVY